MRSGCLVLLLAMLAACTPRPDAPPAPVAPGEAATVIRDVTVVDVANGQLLPHRVVVISGASISSVQELRAFQPAPGARVIDGAGRYLIPGLWDMHSHSLWSEEAMQSFLPLYVSQGVTGIRDMGGRLDLLARYREQMANGHPNWPRIVAAGQVLDGPEPVQKEISVAVADVAAAVAAVDAQAAAGADFIKVYTLLGREPYFAVIAEAKRLGLPVAGHVPAAISVAEAAEAGQRSIEHLRDELGPLCRPTDPAACERLIAVFHRHHTWQVPTLVVLRNKASFADPALATDPRLRTLPPSLQAEWLAEREGKLRRGPDYLASKQAWYADELWAARELVRAQVPILAGSDAGVAFSYPGFSLHEELALLVTAGMTPLQALRAATLAPAEYLDARDTRGSIEAGQDADLVLLRANPLADIAATREIDGVLLRGRWLDRSALDALFAEAAPGVAKPAE
jgi:imidazolonepropionase-like amidohydrolase